MDDIKEEAPEPSAPPRTRTISARVPILGLGGRIALGALGIVVALALVAWFTGPTRAEQQAVAAQSEAVASASAEASKRAEVWLAEQNASASAKSAASASRNQEAEASRAADAKKAAAKNAAEQAVRASIIAKDSKAYVSTVEATLDPTDGNWVVKVSYLGGASWTDNHTESHRVSVDENGKAKVLS